MKALFVLVNALAILLAAVPVTLASTKEKSYSKTVGNSYAGGSLFTHVYATSSTTSKSAKVTASIAGDASLLKKKLRAAEVNLVALSSGSSSYFEVELAGVTVYKKTLTSGKTKVSFGPKTATIFKTPPFSVFDCGFCSVKVSANGGVQLGATVDFDLAAGTAFRAIAKGGISANAYITGKMSASVLWGIANAGVNATVKFFDSKLTLNLIANYAGVASATASLAGAACKLLIVVWADAFWFLEWDTTLINAVWGSFNIKLF